MQILSTIPDFSHPIRSLGLLRRCALAETTLQAREEGSFVVLSSCGDGNDESESPEPPTNQAIGVRAWNISLNGTSLDKSFELQHVFEISTLR